MGLVVIGGAKGRAIVNDPVGACGEKRLIRGGSANGQDAAARGFAGDCAGGGVFDHDAIARRETESDRALLIRFGIGFAALDIAGGYDAVHAIPQAGGTQADFREGAGGRSNHGELTGSNAGEQVRCSGKRDDVGNVFDLGLLHPVILRQMLGVTGVWQEFLNGSQTGAAVGKLYGRDRLQIVANGPAGPDTGHRRGGVDQDAVHIDEKTFAGGFSRGHKAPDAPWNYKAGWLWHHSGPP